MLGEGAAVVMVTGNSLSMQSDVVHQCSTNTSVHRKYTLSSCTTVSLMWYLCGPAVLSYSAPAGEVQYSMIM